MGAYTYNYRLEFVDRPIIVKYKLLMGYVVYEILENVFQYKDYKNTLIGDMILVKKKN